MDYTELLYNRNIQAGLIVLFFLVFSRLIAIIIDKIVISLVKKTETKLDDMIVDETKGPLTFLILFAGIRYSFELLEIQNKVVEISTKIVESLIIFFIFYIAVRVTNILLKHWARNYAKITKSRIDDDILPLARKTFKVIIWIFCALYILSYWGVDVTGLLAGVGIAGIAIGFAVKDSLANIFGGIQIILDKAYKTGDMIEMSNGIVGEVLNIGLRSTRIRTFDNELLVVPNGQMANSVIHNYRQPDDSVRVKVPFGVEYGTSVDKVKKLILKTVLGLEHVLKDPEPQIVFLQMADFSLNFEARFWVDHVSKRFGTKVKANEEIYNALNKAKIGIPFPTRTVHLKK